MKVSLDKENRFLKDGKVDLEKTFIYSGLKAAWCYKKGDATPEIIRETSKKKLLNMGLKTFLDDHGTPDEHYQISVEITGIPKLLCMIINNEHQYTACERSLRYTKIIEMENVTEEEVKNYNKWLKIFENILKEKYYSFFSKKYQTEKVALSAITKIAQENARLQISAMTPTSISYSAPFYQWQKIANFLLYLSEHADTQMKKMIAPYAMDLVDQLINLNIVVTTDEALKLDPEIKKNLHDDRDLWYKNNKEIKLSMFAEDNNFSGINKPNDFGAAINYNTLLSIAAYAELERHRTSYTEMAPTDEYSFSTPALLIGTPYQKEWEKDMLERKGIYPQGELVKVNINTSLKNIINYIGKERACNRAQQQIEDWFVNVFLNDIAAGLEKRPEYTEELKYLKNYLKRCRCAYPDYNCPNPCGQARVRRIF